MEKTIDPFNMDTIVTARAKVSELGSLSFVAIALETVVGNYLTVLLSESSGIASERRSDALTTLQHFLQSLADSVGSKARNIALAQLVQNVKQLAPNARNVQLGDYLNPKEYK